MNKLGIIDLFAGPGGLGEGFSQLSVDNKNPFNIIISIEKDKFAHRTLTLRSFCRQFDNPPPEYYHYLRGKITVDDLYKKYPQKTSLVSDVRQ